MHGELNKSHVVSKCHHLSLYIVSPSRLLWDFRAAEFSSALTAHPLLSFLLLSHSQHTNSGYFRARLLGFCSYRLLLPLLQWTPSSSMDASASLSSYSYLQPFLLAIFVCVAFTCFCAGVFICSHRPHHRWRSYHRWVSPLLFRFYFSLRTSCTYSNWSSNSLCWRPYLH